MKEKAIGCELDKGIRDDTEDHEGKEGNGGNVIGAYGPCFMYWCYSAY